NLCKHTPILTSECLYFKQWFEHRERGSFRPFPSVSLSRKWDTINDNGLKIHNPRRSMSHKSFHSHVPYCPLQNGLPALFWLWILATPGCRPRNRTLTDRSTLCARKVLPANAFTLIRNPDPPPTAPDCTRHWIKPGKAISLSSTRSTVQMLLTLEQRVRPNGACHFQKTVAQSGWDGQACEIVY